MLAEASTRSPTRATRCCCWWAARERQGQHQEHPFGCRRERYFTAFVVAVVLFTIGAAFDLRGRAQALRPASGGGAGLGVRRADLRDHRRGVLVPYGDQGIERRARRAVLESRSSAAQVARTARHRAGGPGSALFGLIFALFGVTMAVITGDGRWDGVGTLMIGVLLAVIAVVLAVEMKSLLVGEGAAPEMGEPASAPPWRARPVTRVIHAHAAPGAEELLVAAKIAVEHNDTAADVAHGIDEAEQRIGDAVPIARVIYLEPDLDRLRSGNASTSA